MATVVFFLALWAVCKALKALFRPRRRPTKTAPKTNPADALYRNLAALKQLQRQRDELNEQLDLINDALDAAPPERDRLRWMKERTRVYGQLATVETKILKLTGA